MLSLAGLALLAALAYAQPLFLDQSFGERDHIIQTLPSRVHLAESLRAGNWPAWWDGVRLGERFASEPNHGAAYPLAWLVALSDPLWGADFILILHVFLTGVGGMLFARRLGAQPLGAFFSGASLMLSGYTSSMVVNGTISLPLAWLPWVAWAALVIAQAETQILGPILVFALVHAAQVSAGNPAYFNAVILAVLLVLAIAPHKRRALGALVLAGLLGTLMGSLSFVLTWFTLQDSVRQAGFALDTSTQWSMHPARALEWFWPSALGLGYRPETSLATLWIPRGNGEYSVWSASVYVTLPVLFCAGVAALRGERQHRWLAFLSLLFVLIALGRYTPLYSIYRTLAWPESLLRYPEKHFATTQVLWSALAGLGLDRLFARTHRYRNLLLFALPALLLALIALLLRLQRDDLAGFLRAATHATGRGILPESTVALITSGAVDGALCAAFVPLAGLLAKNERFRHWAAPLLVTATLLFLVDHAYSQQTLLPREVLRQTPALLAPLPPPQPGEWPRLVRRSKQRIPVYVNSESRALAVHHTAKENNPSRFGFAQVPGYLVAGTPRFEAFMEAGGETNLERIMDLLDIRYLIMDAVHAPDMRMPRRTPQPIGELVTLENTDRRPRAFVAYRWQSPLSDEETFRILFHSRRSQLDFGAIRLAQSVPPPVENTLPPTPCQIEKPRPEHVLLRCHAEAPGFVVLLEEWVHGWSAFVNGTPTPIERADVIARAVLIPAGDHIVEMRYRPPGLLLGLASTTTGWICFVFLFFIRRRSIRQEPKQI